MKRKINIDRLVYKRSKYRDGKNYQKCDEIRAILDQHLVFVFDAPYGQEVYYLTEKYFIKKPATMTNRKYVEKIIQDDSRAERLLDAWLTTTRSSNEKR